MYTKIMVGCVLGFLFTAAVLFQLGIGWVGAACLLSSFGFLFKYLVIDNGRDPNNSAPVTSIKCGYYDCRGRITVTNVEKTNG